MIIQNKVAENMLGLTSNSPQANPPDAGLIFVHHNNIEQKLWMNKYSSFDINKIYFKTERIRNLMSMVFGFLKLLRQQMKKDYSKFILFILYQETQPSFTWTSWMRV